MRRQADISRRTNETNIRVKLDLDGPDGDVRIASGIPFVDHMLGAFSRHGHFGLTVEADGDLQVDAHHTLEDLGLVFGQALRQAVGQKEGIRRFGHAVVPMDEALVRAVVDLSGRPFLGYRIAPPAENVGGFHARLFREFFQGLVNSAGIALHLDMLSGEEVHHVFEGAFKAFGRALDQATRLDPRCTGVPSTKGVLA